MIPNGWLRMVDGWRLPAGCLNTWVFPKIGVGPQNGWSIMENPIKMDDLGVPLFLETPTGITYLLTAGWLGNLLNLLVP